MFFLFSGVNLQSSTRLSTFSLVFSSLLMLGLATCRSFDIFDCCNTQKIQSGYIVETVAGFRLINLCDINQLVKYQPSVTEY